MSANQKGNEEPISPSYPTHTDIFLLAFSVVSPKSLENIKTKWVPVVKRLSPKTPFALIGLKHDRRGVVGRERDETEIPVETALRAARDIGNSSFQGVNETCSHYSMQ